jgi:hypothetical protein
LFPLAKPQQIKELEEEVELHRENALDYILYGHIKNRWSNLQLQKFKDQILEMLF